jgi:acyl CoA:acetate/3-ketoacid CoA transferase beta subunit
VNRASSAAFGRTLTDREVLYITTNGIPPLVANATSEGGKVIAVSTREDGFVGVGDDC